MDEIVWFLFICVAVLLASIGLATICAACCNASERRQKKKNPLSPAWVAAMELLQNDRENWIMPERQRGKELFHIPTGFSIFWDNYGYSGLYHKRADLIDFPLNWKSDIIEACKAMQEIIAVKTMRNPQLETTNENN